MKTFIAKNKDIKREWFLVDAKDKVLGRLASRVATVLMGKRKVIYSPHQDVGDHVVIINADKVKITGKKTTEKTYKSYSAYPGGLNETLMEKMLKNKPDFVIRHAVKGMLPKNKLGIDMLGKLKIYAGEKHPHAAQKPKALEIEKRK